MQKGNLSQAKSRKIARSIIGLQKYKISFFFIVDGLFVYKLVQFDVLMVASIVTLLFDNVAIISG